MAPSFLSFSPRAAATSLFLSRLKKDRVGEKEATEKKSRHVSSAKTVAAAAAAASAAAVERREAGYIFRVLWSQKVWQNAPVL